MPAQPAIAATTEAIWQLLDRELRRVVPGVKVNACPPDRVRQEAGGRQINLFLFEIAEDAHLRAAAREALPAPLALSLRYLLSVYGDDGDRADLSAHQVLSEAMRVLHENAVLPVGATGTDAAATPPLHIVLQPMSLDEMSKLWGSWNSPYRLSVVYDVSPVLLGRRG
ncbi:DUF4255 domain-containing protein [Vineibacter terrae]|uniref:DUF4255 domain-containing protein n=1 Tax=Vineibacter terrae TaxID=2586908 RepID=UPI0015B4E408|nr:DUF4255 domain-containing protein [Vineibacter terrae]